MKVAFLLNFPTNYKGGINYLKNIFYAICTYKKYDYNFILFVPKNISINITLLFHKDVTIIKTSLLTRYSLLWLLNKLTFNFFLSRLLLKHNIDIVSHSNYKSKIFYTINWIPDFQYLHYPNLWTRIGLKKTIKLHNSLVKNSDIILLSSNSAFEDYLIMYKDYNYKCEVLNFVSQPIDINLNDKDYVINKYNIERDYFYLPNQFWQHKNHIIVYKAINELKLNGYNPLLLTSGPMIDYRTKNNHIVDLSNYVIINNLQNNIKHLGIIEYNDVLKLMKFSISLINPSLFEGWSSTIEEAKVIGTRIILSKINVHLEQAPENCFYFNPNDELELYNIMANILSNKLDFFTYDNYKEKCIERTKIFSHKYYSIINNLIKV